MKIAIRNVGMIQIKLAIAISSCSHVDRDQATNAAVEVPMPAPSTTASEISARDEIAGDAILVQIAASAAGGGGSEGPIVCP